jgi:23S rRNA (guanosine2251-2'-O)-methyltransferase
VSRSAKDDDWGEETRFEIRNLDSALSIEEYERQEKFPIHLVLDNLRSAFNVGSLFRTADTARISRILTCGYTAHPPHPRLEKTALGTLAYVSTEHFETTAAAVQTLKDEGIPVYALETTSQSRSYVNVRFPRPLGLVLGNEALGVEREILDLCDEVVEIPMFGFKNSLNVANACSVVLFEVLRQWGAFSDS